ncbi:hypothetical protein F6U93_04375 [Tamlana haliotis]|uniref:Uncharacterized protein n=1 Tax=Pseudotamlana haliotis TaxID=2614804 RepID=A0A6N6MFB0_9FLAO|nr:hypothetical protein F6U93_04375 [Tamlana haliotis]
MSSFEIKTHQIGRTYSNPHFFILNKGQNSGKPLEQPCPNCFVIITTSEEVKNNLYHLTMMLQLGQYFSYCLKGSVIPFITKNDCSKIINKAFNMNNLILKKQLKTMQILNQKEAEYLFLLQKIQQLKLAYIKGAFKKMI